MSRPAQRPLRKLPTLESRRAELETCAFCPKLCRTVCPVSNAEPREVLIPWGKMSNAHALALGDSVLSRESAAPSWACTGCLACREACDHKNPVAATLIESRAALRAAGLAPQSSERVVREAGARDEATRIAASELRARRANESGGALVLVGCAYMRKLPETAASAMEVARALAGDDARPYDACCGLPLLLAGDPEGFRASVERLEKARRGARLVVVDPGCAQALASADIEFELLIDLAAGSLDRFARGAAGVASAAYHDPCALGRGLGRYEAPRRILEHLLGVPAGEFVHARERAGCSGGGGLLPVTMPETSERIAQDRAQEALGRPIVTACASSLRRFRSAGKVAYDLCDLLARGLRAARAATDS